MLDAIVGAAVEEPVRADPPAAPIVGASYIVATGATAEWAGHDGTIAAFTLGGWRFVPPVDGLTVLVKSTGETLRYANGSWSRVLAARQAAITDVSGGTTVDVESRAAISAILGSLRAHGLIAP